MPPPSAIPHAAHEEASRCREGDRLTSNFQFPNSSIPPFAQSHSTSTSTSSRPRVGVLARSRRDPDGVGSDRGGMLEAVSGWGDWKLKAKSKLNETGRMAEWGNGGIGSRPGVTHGCVTVLRSGGYGLVERHSSPQSRLSPRGKHRRHGLGRIRTDV